MTQPIVLGTLPDEYFNVNHELRQTEVCFRFEDESGQTHTAQLTRLVRRGFGPDASIMLWYDPANPARFTRFGPGSWILMLIASLAALAWLFTGGATALSALSLLAR